MRGPKTLLGHENRWVTNMGAWFPGERVVFRGKDLFHELKDLPWMGLLLYGITGRIFNEKQIELFEGIWVISTSYPEPRLWNNRVAALAGTARSTVALGVGAAVAVSEAIIYGHRPLLGAMEFLLWTSKRRDAGKELDELIVYKLEKTYGDDKGRPGSGRNRRVAALPGFGRPVTDSDERITPLLDLAEKVGLNGGAMVQLAFEIEDVLVANGYALRMNVAALMAALAADQGLSPREFYHYVILCFSVGILTCAKDAEEHASGTFFPLPSARICYEGVSKRLWDAKASLKATGSLPLRGDLRVQDS